MAVNKTSSVTSLESYSFCKNKFKSISLPRLNNLTPNIVSTTLKLMEESGELAEAIGKFNNMSGENNKFDKDEVINKVGKELLDVAQTAITMMFVLEEQFDVDIQELVNEHCEKLINRGYLVM